LLFFIACILRVAKLRSEDVSGVLGQRSGISQETEMALRVLNHTTERELF
jgi:hypothetical protein